MATVVAAAWAVLLVIAFSGGGPKLPGWFGGPDAPAMGHAGQPVSIPLAKSPPAELHIPAIELHAEDLVELGLTPARTLQVPWDYDEAGWYNRGATPGEVGPAVIAGHVDSVTAPAVFYRLHELEPGDTVEVRREDGVTAVFTVDEVGQYPKNAFPTEQVYADTEDSQLRLITCGGTFDEDTRSYQDNIVVYATLTGAFGPV